MIFVHCLMFHCRQRDLINVTPSKRIETEWDNQGHAHLTIKKVKPSDAGLYYCVAQSKSGRAKCSAHLYVKGQLLGMFLTLAQF